MTNNTTIHYVCIPKCSGIASIVLSLLALPLYILLVKVLVKDVGLSQPRHQIMLALTISDALQIFGVSSVTLLVMILQLTTESVVCGILRDFVVFTSSLTIIVSSLALTTFAIERMIICIHFLKYRQFFRKSRMTKLLCGYWLFGMIIAAIATVTNDARKTETSVNETTSFQIICITIVLPCALIISAIYIRIFLFSRERTTRVIPIPVSSNFASTNALKKKQIQIAVVAGIVCVAYVGFMVPMALTYFLELVGLIKNRPYDKTILVCIAMVNNLADPFIYGFGMTQTRQILIRMLKEIFHI